MGQNISIDGNDAAGEALMQDESVQPQVDEMIVQEVEVCEEGDNQQLAQEVICSSQQAGDDDMQEENKGILEAAPQTQEEDGPSEESLRI